MFVYIGARGEDAGAAGQAGAGPGGRDHPSRSLSGEGLLLLLFFLLLSMVVLLVLLSLILSLLLLSLCRTGDALSESYLTCRDVRTRCSTKHEAVRLGAPRLLGSVF